MKSFKFLDNNGDDYTLIPDETASWMWHNDFMLRDNIEGYTWQLKTIRCDGIINFLNQFPNLYIVPVYSIAGNNIRHDSFNQGHGWGFNIQTEHLNIEYFQLVPNN